MMSVSIVIKKNSSMNKERIIMTNYVYYQSKERVNMTKGPWALDCSPESLSQGEDIYHKF